MIQRKENVVRVEMRETGEVLAACFIGDDDTLETIADLLSVKKLGADAMKLRQMAQDARKPTASKARG